MDEANSTAVSTECPPGPAEPKYRREPALRYQSDDSLEAVLASRVG
jgi:hypothetical protein